MSENKSRREFISQSGKMVTACALFGATGSVAYAADSAKPTCETGKPMTITAKHYYLDNVLLEAGFNFDGSVATSTRTELKTLEIKDGKIVALRDNGSHADATLPHYDAGKKLMLPAMRDMHIHLDKTFYGGPWRSLNRPAGTTIQDMIRLEQKLLPELQPYTQERAEKLIDLIQSKGSTLARSHCNIEPVSGLKNLENLQAVLARRSAGFDCEIVAFPQHGLLLSNSEKLMREAMQAGAHYVGGLDPTNVDGAMEKSLDLMFQIALDYDKGVDIHLHEPGTLGAFSVELIAERTRALSLQGRVTISHVFCLGMIDDAYLGKLIDLLLDNRIAIMSLGSGRSEFPPLKRLYEAGVRLCTGTDGVRDTWSPNNSVDILERVTLLAYRCGFRKEEDFEMLLDIATYGGASVMGDEGYGLAVGKQADFVIVPGATPTEAIVDRPPRTLVVKRGRIVAQ